jgi:uncharacterized damage-inducible protein DinB
VRRQAWRPAGRRAAAIEGSDMRYVFAFGVCLVTAVAAVQAQGANALSDAVRASWQSARGNIKESAAQMPEADYAFKPVDSVRTFGQILAHIAGANYVFCAAAKGEKPPHAEDEFEKSATTKAAIVQALDDSLAYCDGAFAALTDATAADTVDMPFGMPQGRRASPLLMNTGHLNEHYGNLVTYFRIKGMVPPSSQRM